VEQEITARLARAERGELDPDQPLYFDNGTHCTAGTLTKAFDRKRLRDPLEPDYGPSQAVFHWNKGGMSWRIVSWAHGLKKVYRLAAGARQDDDTWPPQIRYRATPQGLVWEKPTKDGPTDVLLTNFTATITAEITEDDGAELQLRFALAAQRKGQTHCFEIPAAQFAGMSWVTPHLGAMAIVMPGMTLQDHARAAIQLLSTQVDHRRVYTHLGWRKIGEDWCYLHAEGAIGAQGAVPDVTVAPGDALTSYRLPSPPDGEATRVAIRASFRVLDVAPDAVTIPVFTALWRVVLGKVDFSLHMAGQTGQGKTAIAALVMF
jgi:hypothetical protein